MLTQLLLFLCVSIAFSGYINAQAITTLESSTTATQTPTPSIFQTTTSAPNVSTLGPPQLIGIVVNSFVGGSIIIVLMITAVGYGIFFAVRHKRREQDKAPLVTV